MKRLNLSEWAITHRPLVLFMILLLGAAGLFSYFNLGRAEDPSFTIKVMVVNVALARRHRDRDAGAGRRQGREEAAGAAVPRPGRELFAARRLVHSRDPERPHAARQGEGPLVSGAQEGRRHPRQPAGRDHRPELQRRVRRRLFGALHADRRRPHPGRPQGARGEHPPAPAARAGRQQGRHHRRAPRAHLHRVQPHQARDARPDAAADLRERHQAECRRGRRLGRYRVRPHQPARHRRLHRRRRDRRRAGAGRTAGCSASATSRP